MNAYMMILTSIKTGVTLQVPPHVGQKIQTCFSRTFEETKSIKAAQDAVFEGLSLADGVSVRFSEIPDGPATPADMVEEFHATFGHPVNEAPVLPAPERAELRLSLIVEEAQELAEALEMPEGTDEERKAKLVAIADALGDLEYVVNGAAHEFGIPLVPVTSAIHRSNMSKLDAEGKPIYREDGKVLKSELYEEPDLAKVLFPTP